MFPAEITVHNPSITPGHMPPFLDLGHDKEPPSARGAAWCLSYSGVLHPAARWQKEDKKTVAKVLENCWQPPYSQTIKFIPVVT